MLPSAALAQSISCPLTPHGPEHAAFGHAGSPVRQTHTVLSSMPLALVNLQVAVPVVSGVVAIDPRCDCGSASVQKFDGHDPITVPMAMLRRAVAEPVGPVPLNVTFGGDVQAEAPPAHDPSRSS